MIRTDAQRLVSSLSKQRVVVNERERNDEFHKKRLFLKNELFKKMFASNSIFRRRFHNETIVFKKNENVNIPRHSSFFFKIFL